MKTIICDIDGTIADCTHRLHYLSGSRKNWDAFFGAVHKDILIDPIANLMGVLAETGLYQIVLVSGRPESTRETTEKWLYDHNFIYTELYMRANGDHRQDYLVKSQILDALLGEGRSISYVFDDRPQVIAMWRERGLTCLQVREWEGDKTEVPNGLLTIMVGPACAGKSTWLDGESARHSYGILPHHIVSSDKHRVDLCGDIKDQSKNALVFAAIHAEVKARIKHGLPCVVDATHLRRKDRLEAVALAEGSPVRYIILNRPLEYKLRDAGWRMEDGFDFITKHDHMFNSQLKDILTGDGHPNVEVIDLRQVGG